MKSRSDPLRPRSYLHFDERPSRTLLKELVGDPAQVARWQFLPLIRASVHSKKIRSKNKITGSFDVKTKERPICYASHKDAALYATYGNALVALYEKTLNAEGLSDCVTAFRPSTGKCNIHYAHEAFQWIEKNRPCVALAYDISKFFDTLDHAILKRKLCEVLGAKTLPADYFSIFRSLTRHAVVERDAAYEVFGISKNNDRAGGRKKICTAEQFREKIVGGGLLKVNPDVFGIPQGTPASAIMSNIYMLDFDRAVATRVGAAGGVYRRYCDDILCIVSPDAAKQVDEFVIGEIQKVKLSIQVEKVGRFKFDATNGVICPPLQYLGLTFDGEKILLRPGGIGRFYSRMRNGVRAAAASRDRAAREAGVPKKDVGIRKAKLLSKFTYAGKRNFVTYAHRAAKLTGDDGIRRQISRHIPALNAALKNEDG